MEADETQGSTQHRNSQQALESKDESTYQEEGQSVINEQLYCIKEKQLQCKLHRSIVALYYQDKEEHSISSGSGVLISRNLVLTSAHNIFSRKHNKEYSNFKVYLPAANGVAKEYFYVQGFRYPDIYKTCQDSNKMEYDYAIMKLKKQVNQKYFLPVQQVCRDCLNRNRNTKPLEVFGYPHCIIV